MKKCFGQHTLYHLALAMILMGLTGAGGQVALSRLNLVGQEVQSITLYGIEYASQEVLNQVFMVTRSKSLVKVQGFGHTLLLPIDQDQRRATTVFNTVQLDTRRVLARSATLVKGKVYLPLDTLARGLGAIYKRGDFSLAPAALSSVSSRAGTDSDRLVLNLSRGAPITSELRGTTVTLVLKGVTGQTRRYTTRGTFIPQAQVIRKGDDLALTFKLPSKGGYRVYPVVNSEGTRIVIDAGPGIPRTAPALLDRLTGPLIVLDPFDVDGLGRDITLDIARRAAELLNKAGWKVKLTRDAQINLNLSQKLALARCSDVYLALDLGRFPGTGQGGVNVYEQVGYSNVQLVKAIRSGLQAPYADLVVGDLSVTRRLSELLRGELRGEGVSTNALTMKRILMLEEAPQAALLLEVGWVGSPEDRAQLSVEAHLQAIAVAVARSVATYLTARASNAGQFQATTAYPSMSGGTE